MFRRISDSYDVRLLGEWSTLGLRAQRRPDVDRRQTKGRFRRHPGHSFVLRVALGTLIQMEGGFRARLSSNE